MSWLRLFCLLLWTVGFVFLMLFLFGVHMLGDCAPPPRGGSCWADKEAAPRYFLLAGIAIYVPLTWFAFFRGRRSR